MPRAEQRQKAVDHIKAAFLSFTEARRDLTLWEFQEAVSENLSELGGQGFVASVGSAIVAGASK